jgi:hypothetical protein
MLKKSIATIKSRKQVFARKLVSSLAIDYQRVWQKSAFFIEL